jgi:hypothetical protein
VNVQYIHKFDDSCLFVDGNEKRMMQQFMINGEKIPSSKGSDFFKFKKEDFLLNFSKF